MKTPIKAMAAVLLLFLAAAITGNAQFKAVGPPPYTATVARQKIKALVAKLDPANRQQSVTTISGLLGWYRDIADDELIAAWKKDEGRENLPDVITTLADARVAAAVVEYSWRQQRQATFNLAYAPMLGNLMLRFPDSAKPFLDDLLGSGDAVAAQPVELSEQEAYAVCRILLDMPDIRDWKMNGLKILPRYREIAGNLLAADVNEGDRDKQYRAMRWIADLKASAPPPANAQTGRRIMQPPASLPSATPSADGKSGSLECTGDPIPPNGEYTFPNVLTVNRRFEYDRKIWDVRLTPGEGETHNLILKNKSARLQKNCVVRWSLIP
ncbi:MAG TPA: hypothetical protein VGG72_10005 [Bryobacteraceae bacterium]